MVTPIRVIPPPPLLPIFDLTFDRKYRNRGACFIIQGMLGLRMENFARKTPHCEMYPRERQSKGTRRRVTRSPRDALTSRCNEDGGVDERKDASMASDEQADDKRWRERD